MKTYLHLWYLAQSFLEWEMFQTKVVEKIKTLATDDNITRRMRFACWITQATGTHSAYVILIAFPRQHWLRERAAIVLYTYTVLLEDKFLNQRRLCSSWDMRSSGILRGVMW
jgi:hypothetical protein